MHVAAQCSMQPPLHSRKVCVTQPKERGRIVKEAIRQDQLLPLLLNFFFLTALAVPSSIITQPVGGGSPFSPHVASLGTREHFPKACQQTHSDLTPDSVVLGATEDLVHSHLS